MATVVMPQLGESVTEGTILQWFKQPGDPVKLDDSLCEIETEKVTAELPSPFEGTMGEIHVPEGETVEVGVRLCEVVEAGAPAPVRFDGDLVSTRPGSPPGDLGPRRSDLGPPGAAVGGWTGGPMAIPPEEREWTEPTPLSEEGPEPVPRVVEVPAATSAPPVAGAGRSRSATFYSPAVMRLAEEHGVELAKVKGTGTGGRVTRSDVEAFLAAGAPSAPVSEQPEERRPAASKGTPRPVAQGGIPVVLSATRKTIAARLSKSNLEAPQAWTMVEADITGVVKRRAEERERFERNGLELTLLPYVAEAVCTALREVPSLNARWDGPQLLQFAEINLGVAVAAESGLVVPVIHDAGSLSLEGIARAITDLADRARTRRLQLSDIEGGTFTLNNTGAFGSIASKPIVNHPEVGIVTFERAVQRPVVRDDAIAIRWLANLCLSFDHRALDGSEAGRFLSVLKGALEDV